MWTSRLFPLRFRPWKPTFWLAATPTAVPRTTSRPSLTKPAPVATRKGLDTFLQNPFVRGVFQNMRTSMRRKCVPIAVMLADDPRRSKQSYGWVLDKSTGGLCISAETPRNTGSRLSVKATSASDTSPWVEIEVRSCRRDGRRWDLDCTFGQSPLQDLLVMFG